MGLGYLRQPRPPGRLTPCQRAICALLALLAFALPAPALAQIDTDSETADAQVGIITRGAIISVEDMDFGVIAQTAAGTITMTPNVVATCSPSAGIVHTGACEPATFSIMFKKHDKNRVREMNGGVITLVGPGGATMTVTNMTISVTDMTLVSTGGPPGTFGRYDIQSDSGIAQFRIGGRLNIPANRPAGVYSGTLTVNVILN
jgi:spore coat protein U-like protein